MTGKKGMNITMGGTVIGNPDSQVLDWLERQFGLPVRGESGKADEPCDGEKPPVEKTIGKEQ